MREKKQNLSWPIDKFYTLHSFVVSSYSGIPSAGHLVMSQCHQQLHNTIQQLLLPYGILKAGGLPLQAAHFVPLVLPPAAYSAPPVVHPVPSAWPPVVHPVPSAWPPVGNPVPSAWPPVAYSAYATAFLWNPEWDLQLQRIYIMTFVMFCQHRLCIHHAYQSMCKCGPEKCLVICFAELEHLCSNLKY